MEVPLHNPDLDYLHEQAKRFALESRGLQSWEEQIEFSKNIIAFCREQNLVVNTFVQWVVRYQGKIHEIHT